MSNFPPNPYSSAIGPPQMNSDSGTQITPQNVQYGQVPRNQLPPGIPGHSAVKQDPNSNSPLQLSSVPQSGIQQNVNNHNQSANSSPAFNQAGIVHQQPQAHSSPIQLPIKPAINMTNPNTSSIFPNSMANVNSNFNSHSPYPSNFSQQSRQINDNAPPINSSQHQPFLNGPQMIPPVTNMAPSSSPNRMPLSGAFNPPFVNRHPISTSAFGVSASNLPLNQGPPTTAISTTMGHPGVISQPSLNQFGPPRNNPLSSAPTVCGPAFTGLQSGAAYSTQPSHGPQSLGMNGPSSLGAPGAMPSRPMPPMSGPPVLPAVSRPAFQTYPGPPNTGLRPQINPPTMNPNVISGPQSMPLGMQTSIPKPIGIPPAAVPPGPPSGPLGGPPKGSMQNRYPQMAPTNYTNQQQPLTQQPIHANQYPQQYSTHALAQQMGQLSVTKQGFDQLWGHQVTDLLQCKHILPEYPEDPPEIRLSHQFADAPNCSPEIFRCTINRIPESNSLLQKSRLPLGLLIHPFKDLNHLPVIQCTSIVRCRACRTYINPFVYFVDAKRWKCNLCYRVNELPDEFQYDPVSKSYGDPTRRPEIKSATIEFIAPSEYMLRPPQPAIYLFLLDVSQLARESGYIQVVCDTLKSCLDQLPGDARTQIGFVCYDEHVHFYLMSDHLTRPKEVTVLDIDDVFLPSPESLLVNLGERRELVKELLTILPQRFSSGGCPASALGSALQAAYKLMAATGGRVTVFQTCLPNIGPGALQSREDPNARSSKDVAHLNPATDFYKRLALECSGAQVAVDLFLLNSQYADLATLSGMSKFSAGSVHHLPLFKSTRPGHADQLSRMLNRYLTRKIGFEAVMRVRCTRGISIHTFHGNFFVRSTDLLSLPNVSPDAGFGMQLSIDESLADLQHVCFQAALLYTSSKGERRIRVHTLALPLATTLPDVLHAADQQCIIGLLAKMAVDRCATASLTEAREALINVAVDVLGAYRVAQNAPAAGAGLLAPATLRLLPLLLLALLKRRAFRTGTSTRLDDRVADMCALKTQPLPHLVLAAHPALYAVHRLPELQPPPPPPPPPRSRHDADAGADADADADDCDLPRLPLTAERINSNGAYLMDDGDSMIMYVGHNVSPAYLSETFGVTAFSQLPDEARSLPAIDSQGNKLLRGFIDRLNDDRPCPASLLILRDNSPSRLLFTERLIEDRIESAFSYYEFLQHIKTQVK